MVTFTLILPTKLEGALAGSFVYQTVLAASLVEKGLVIASESSNHVDVMAVKGYPLPAVVCNDGPDVKVFFQAKAAVGSILMTKHSVGLMLPEEELVERVRMAVREERDVDPDVFAALSSATSSLFAKVLLAGYVLSYSKGPKTVMPLAMVEWSRSLVSSHEPALSLVEEYLAVSVAGRQNVKEGVAFVYDETAERLPRKDARNILITAALPYVNNVPHLGNIIGAVLSADVYARYCRLRGYETLFVCGTDEYGTATETKALEEGISCADLCAKYYKLHAAIYDWFGISTDIFGRTSTAQQTAITHEIFKGLYDNEYFFEQSMDQTYCEQCARFLADRYVEGVCPHCAYGDARGDQCDGCGKLLDPTELLAPRCKVCRATPVVRSSNHLFLDLSKLQPKCDAFVSQQALAGHWSANSTSISKAWLTEGLKPRCMTRDLRWGTPVPLPGFEDKVFYVWFDACFGYISITACYTEKWRQWWQADASAKVELVQFMGKDNVPFHTVIFPSTLIGTASHPSSQSVDSITTPWTLLHHINTTEYLNYEQGKFSKSRGIGVFGNDARDSGIPVAFWRYYLLAVRPETTDAAFSWDDFGARANNELLANLGNFVSRITKFTAAKLHGRVPLISTLTEKEDALIGKVDAELAIYLEQMEGIHLKAALKTVMAISSLGNAYLTDGGLDQRLLSQEPARCATILAVALNLAYLLSALLDPFIPTTAADIRRMLNAPVRCIPGRFEVDLLREGHALGLPFHLFSKIEEARLRELRAKFVGKQVK